MTEIEAIIMGLVQGLTEFLPVSSSGHLTIFSNLFGVQKENLSFEVIVHAATVLSTIVVFRKEIWKLIEGLFNLKMNPEKNYIFKICVSMVPVLIVGLLFKDFVKDMFGSGLLIVGLMLIITAILLTLSEILAKRQIKKSVGSCTGDSAGRSVSYKDAFIIGLAQAVAVMPGLSRSGSTISTGLMLGVKRSEVAQFSFLMVLIPVLGEAFLELTGGEFSIAESGISATSLLLGFISAFIAGLFACKLMINLVKNLKLWGFAIYCFIAGAACVISNMCC